MNYLKRRFSSGDLQGEGPESDENSNQMLNLANPILNKFSTGQSTKENKLKMHEEDDVINKAKKNISMQINVKINFVPKQNVIRVQTSM